MMGSEIEIRYTAYKFAGRKPSTSAIYMTNDPEQIAELVEDGLNADYWSEEPMKIKLGTTKIIKGLEISLLGCREGDIAEVYMTQPASYDNKDMGIVEKSSAIMWEYTILRVKNN
jgi:FKBP-type peptidyl-prolyl cis-trans isomerase 2